MKLAESLSPLTKKLDTINESTKKLGEDIKESNSADNQKIVPSEIDNIQTNLKSLPNNSIFSVSMRQKLGSLLKSRNRLKITQDEIGQATILGIPIQISGGDRIRINDNIFELTRDLYKALSSTSYNCKTMKNESDIFMMNNIINDLRNTGKGDKSSKRKKNFTIKLLERVVENQNKTFNEIDLESQRIKIIIPSNIIDIYTRLELLQGSKLSGHTDTLTEASNLIDEFYKRCETQNEQQYRNALNKFST